MKIVRAVISTFGALLLCGLASNINAQSISLAPTSVVNNVNNGDTVSFNVVMDFSGYPNGTLGGGFDIIFDSSALQFLGFTRFEVGDPAFSRDPDIFVGLLESWAVGDFNGLPAVAVLGNVWFQVLPTMGASTTVSTSATNGVAGPWIDATDFVTLIPVVYNEVLITSPPRVGGSATGITIEDVTCKNKSTKQPKVKITIDGTATTWDCEAAGLIVNPGDEIEMKVKGTAD
ncbi:MAG: hypothetical protein P8X98_08855 [Woeseiaceae bacterium]